MKIVSQDILDENYSTIFEKAKRIKKLWRMCDLTLIDKVNMVNTLVGSLFVYKMQVLETITDELKHKFERMVEEFIWNGRKPKLKTSLLQLTNVMVGKTSKSLKKTRYGLENTVDIQIAF